MFFLFSVFLIRALDRIRLKAWGACSKSYIDKIRILLNKAMREIAHVNWNAPSTSLYHLLKILKLDDVYR